MPFSSRIRSKYSASSAGTTASPCQRCVFDSLSLTRKCVPCSRSPQSRATASRRVATTEGASTRRITTKERDPGDVHVQMRQL